MNKVAKSLYFYLEDAPVVESTFATGLSKALIPMLRELAPRSAGMSVVQTHRYFAESQVAKISPRVHVSPRLDYLFARATARLPFALARVVAWTHGTWLGLRRRVGGDARMARVVWSAIGVDPLSVVRVGAFAAAMGLPFEAYLVDDIETHPANAATKSVHRSLSRLLRKASNVYTITPELGERFAQRYGIDAKCLPLTASIPHASLAGSDPKFFAAYLGSINHLYEDGLRVLLDAVRELRVSTGRDLRIRVVAPRDDLVRALGTDVPDWVSCGAEREQLGLAAALADSQFCYLPYSHDESARVMVGSSFPSKLLDYLAWARMIVVYAPVGSVPYNFFKREALDFCTNSESDLRERLRELADESRTGSTSYREALMRNHGPGRAAAVIFGDTAIAIAARR